MNNVGIPLLISSVVAIALAYVDYRLISMHLNIKLWKKIKFWTLVISGCAFVYQTYPLGQAALVLIAFAACYWMIFDLALNKLRGLDIFYVNPKSSPFDVVLSHIPPDARILFKFAIMFISLVIQSLIYGY